MSETANARMQQRRGTSEVWASLDPVLLAGEFGLETDTGVVKIGDGVKKWSELEGVGGADVHVFDGPEDEVVTPVVEPYDDSVLAGRVSDVESALSGHTVGADVPAGAVFTDTVYDDTALSARVTTMENEMPNALKCVSSVAESEANKITLLPGETGLYLKVKNLPFSHIDAQISFLDSNILYYKKYPDRGWVAEQTYSPDEDTGWLEVVEATGIGSGISYRKKNGVVYIQCLSNGINRDDIIQTGFREYPDALPVGYRPSQNISTPLIYWTDSPKLGYFAVTSSGLIRLGVLPQDISEGWGLIYPQATLSYPV